MKKLLNNSWLKLVAFLFLERLWRPEICSVMCLDVMHTELWIQYSLKLPQKTQIWPDQRKERLPKQTNGCSVKMHRACEIITCGAKRNHIEFGSFYDGYNIQGVLPQLWWQLWYSTFHGLFIVPNSIGFCAYSKLARLLWMVWYGWPLFRHNLLISSEMVCLLSLLDFQTINWFPEQRESWIVCTGGHLNTYIAGI